MSQHVGNELVATCQDKQALRYPFAFSSHLAHLAHLAHLTHLAHLR